MKRLSICRCGVKVEQSKVDQATKRKPTRSANVPTRSKPKRRKADKHIVKHGDTIHTVFEANCEGVYCSENDDLKFIQMVKQVIDFVPFKLDTSCEKKKKKTDVKALETAVVVTQKEEQVVNVTRKLLRNLLRNL